jgi:quercetin dioxygenase-like cupin family protein
MQLHKLSEMTKGWFVGDFSPVVLHSQAAEVAVKSYTAGTVEPRHLHKVASEVTLIVSGRARMGETVLEPGDIVLIEPGEATDFEALTDVTTVVVKTPSVAGDKYEC